MGKYMKKSKIAGGDVVVAVMESSSLGVRTRAKTLALKKSPSSSPPPDSGAAGYLQLRSRRLEKVAAGARREAPEQPRRCCGGAVASSVKSAVVGEIAEEENVDVDIEGSFGENLLEVDGRDRSTRESTPCSLIRDSNAIHTPASTTRQRTHQIIHEHMQRNIPTAYEMEEFFAYAEKQQQTIFMDKYNFDIVNDVPLPGRYEWVPVLH